MFLFSCNTEPLVRRGNFRQGTTRPLIYTGRRINDIERHESLPNFRGSLRENGEQRKELLSVQKKRNQDSLGHVAGAVGKGNQTTSGGGGPSRSQDVPTKRRRGLTERKGRKDRSTKGP